MKRITIVLAWAMMILSNFGPASAIPVGNNVEYIPPPRNLGINILAPLAKLDVNGQVLIRGGNPSNGLVLTALDSNGLAAWEAIPMVSSDFTDANLFGLTTVKNNLAFDLAAQILGPVTLNGDLALKNSTVTGLLVDGLLKAENINANGTISSSGGFDGDGFGLENLDANAINGVVANANNATNLIAGGTIADTSIEGIVDFGMGYLEGALLNGTTSFDGELVFTNSSVFNGEGLTFKNVDFGGVAGNIGNATTASSANFATDAQNLIAGGTIADTSIEGVIDFGTGSLEGAKLGGTSTFDGSLVFEAGSSFNGTNLSFTNIDLVGNVGNVGNADTANTANLALSLSPGVTLADITATTFAMGASPAPVDINETDGVSPITSIVRIQGDGVPVDLAATIYPIQAGFADGQILILRGVNDTNTVTFHAGDHLVLNMGVRFIMGLRDTLTLVYDSQTDEWIEISRSDTNNL